MDPSVAPQTHFPKMMNNCIEDQAYVQGVWEDHPPLSQNYVDYQNYSSLFEDQFDPYYAMLNNAIHYHQPSYFLQDFEEICGDFGMWEYKENAQNPMCMAVNENVVNALDQGTYQMSGHTNYYSSSSNNSRAMKRQGKKYNNSNALELEEIKKYFHLPITKAAKKMNVGLTFLKKRCRQLKIMRWPHRKIKSLKSLIENVKEMGLSYKVDMLEKHKRMLETVPELELTEETKKLRQACFKANYKKRRSMMLQQTSTSI